MNGNDFKNHIKEFKNVSRIKIFIHCDYIRIEQRNGKMTQVQLNPTTDKIKLMLDLIEMKYNVELL